MKYRKTALVEAQQFLPPHSIPEGCYQKGTIGDVASGHGEWFLKTLEAEHPLRYADYVCIGVQGERWNVEQSIFEATYEQANESTPPVNQDAVREALEPFALWSEEWPEGNWSDQTLIPDTDIRVGDLRRARSTLAALATPPLDNTGLDAATVERCAGECDMEEARATACIGQLAGASMAAETARTLGKTLRALASGDRS